MVNATTKQEISFAVNSVCGLTVLAPTELISRGCFVGLPEPQLSIPGVAVGCSGAQPFLKPWLEPATTSASRHSRLSPGAHSRM